MRTLFAGLAAVVLSACSGATAVPQVELDRYDGLWYEIASIPQSFQQDCYGTTATYTQLPSGDLEVLNSCNTGSLTGPVNDIVGSAYATDSTNAKLKVNFGFFPADYWVVALDSAPGPDEYQYAAVSSPLPGFLWILSRTPQMDPVVLSDLLLELDAQGLDTNALQYTVQPITP